MSEITSQADYELVLNELCKYTKINQQKRVDEERERLLEALSREYELNKRRMERELLENEARLRRAQKEREDWWRHKDQIKEERKRQKYEKERLHREELKADKEAAENLKARREYGSVWAVTWRDTIDRLRARRNTILDPVEKLQFDMHAACDALDAWAMTFPRVPACPLLSAWQTRAIAQFNKWSQKNWRDTPEYKCWPADERERPITYSTLHLAHRRPTLSEYDNKRDSIPDRYRFGIYAGQYDG